ncbi:MAG TPA: condensation domain-containing protein, partial [Thermoanaerobaculia bacterium]|nr:condensation domain-containing protein [Thermoanaerobaculia bacterium]
MTFPLSFAQERLWYLDRLAPGVSIYNLPFGFALAGSFHVGAFRQTLAAIVARHETLRTSLPEVAGQPVQEIAETEEITAPWELPVADLAALPAGARQAEAERLARGFARRPFDLARGPLFRAAVLKLAAGEHQVLLNLHHTVGDGASLNLLAAEISALYPGFAGRQPATLPDLPIQYADYAVWQRGWLQGQALERRLAWWREALAGMPEVFSLPADRPRPPVQSFRGGLRRSVLAAREAAALSAFAQAQGSTLFAVLLAAYYAWLHRLTGEVDLPVGSPVASRDRTELEGLIGFFVNTLVLRGRISPGVPFSALLRQTREVTVAAFLHPDLPFERLVAEISPRPDLGYNPLFQVMLAFQQEGPAPPRLPGLASRRLDFDLGGARVDLALSVEGQEEGLTLCLEHGADLFDPATAERFLRGYLQLLAGALADPELPLPDLPLLGEGERHQLLVEWNAEAWTETTGEPLAHQLFAIQAARQPEAVALLAAGETLTYGEFDRRATRLARHLRTRGLGRWARVGLLAERSADLILG